MNTERSHMEDKRAELRRKKEAMQAARDGKEVTVTAKQELTLSECDPDTGESVEEQITPGTRFKTNERVARKMKNAGQVE